MFKTRMLVAIAICGLTLTLLGCGRSPVEPEVVDPIRILTAENSSALPTVSGLVHHRGALYLAVHDTKSDEDGPRLAVVRIDRQAAPAYRELTLDWQSHGGPSHDLESIAAIPGRAGQYLAAESNNRGQNRRRILHLEVSGSRLPEVEARLIGFFELPAVVKNIEGIAIVPRHGGPAQLGLCERNERKGDSTRGRDEERYAFIRWAELDFERYALRPRFVTRLRSPSWPRGKGLRTCSELYFDQAAEQLWVAATLDDDEQGHDSMILRMDFDDAMLDGNGEWQLTPLARIPGYKVEAIAAPLLPGWGPTLGSDGDGDLDAGRIWPVNPGSWK